MSDRLQEIHARLEAANRYSVEWPDYGPGTLAEFIAHAPADIAWLLDEVMRLRELTDHDEHWRRQFYALRNRVRKAGISI